MLHFETGPTALTPVFVMPIYNICDLELVEVALLQA
jgi:hypothetical protein